MSARTIQLLDALILLIDTDSDTLSQGSMPRLEDVSLDTLSQVSKDRKVSASMVTEPSDEDVDLKTDTIDWIEDKNKEIEEAREWNMDEIPFAIGWMHSGFVWPKRIQQKITKNQS